MVKPMNITQLQQHLHELWHELWQQRVMAHYQQLAEREQRLILFACIVLPFMLVIFTIILPRQDALHAKKHDLKILQQQAQEAEMLALRLQKQGDQPARGNTLTVVDQQARQHAVRQFITSLRPQMGNGASRLWVQMKNSPYDKTIHFFAALAKQGLTITQIKFQKSKQAGIVNVQAVVQ